MIIFVKNNNNEGASASATSSQDLIDAYEKYSMYSFTPPCDAQLRIAGKVDMVIIHFIYNFFNIIWNIKLNTFSSKFQFLEEK